MIPTMIVFGLILGRWWRFTVATGTLAWPLMLLATDTVELGTGLIAAAGLGLANTAAGLLVHQAVLRLIRRFRTA